MRIHTSVRRGLSFIPLLLVLPLAALSCHDSPTDPDPGPNPDPGPGAPASLLGLTAAQNQTAQVNAQVAIAPSVQVVDRTGRGVPGVAVTFAVQGGGGSVTGATQTTDFTGVATVSTWRLGPTPGANALAAQVAGLQPFVFNATATPPPLGNLAVNVTGLPAGVLAMVGVTGPNGYGADVTGSTNLTSIPAGAYTITAQALQHGSSLYSPTPASQSVTVPAGGAAQVAIAYGVAPPMNLVLDGALFFQTVQSAQGTVPMMAEKPAILRVWVRATHANAHRVPVRLRILRGTQVLHDTREWGPPVVPTQFSVADTVASWDFFVPAEAMQPGISASIHVDPDNAVPELSETDNLYPPTGTAPVAVQAVPPFRIRFLRVCMAYPPYACGVITNEDDMLRTLYSVFPVWRREIIPGYQVSTGRNVASNVGWTEILQDLAAQRVLDGYGNSTVHYMGILTSPPQTLLGLALIGGFSGLAKYDNPVEGRTTIAHELGHNFGRHHAPCGGAPEPDPGFPTADASVGTYGVDIWTGRVTTPAYKDIMSYCPPDMTASEYTYRGVMQARMGPFPSVAPANQAPQPILVVAGRRVDGVLTLEPAFDATTAPAVPARGGSFSLTGVDEDGKTLFSYRFEPTEAGHRAGKAQIFAFGIPISQHARERLHELRLSDGVRRVTRRSPLRASLSREGTEGAATIEDLVSIAPEGNGVRVRWSLPRYEALWLRESQSGRMVAMLRNGSGYVATTEREFDVQLSDGVHTVRGKVRSR
jgi:hypothetical protein